MYSRGSFEMAIRQQSEKFKSAHQLNKPGAKTVISLDEVPAVMARLVNGVESGAPSVYQHIKRCMHCEQDADVREAMSRWHDVYSLDLVHYLIINECKEILSYILEESCVFPTSRQPPICPYAHLAAYLGSTECVKIILNARPGDFFQCQRIREHYLKLPPHIVDRLGLLKQRDTRRYDTLISRVKSFNIDFFPDLSVDKMPPSNIKELINTLEDFVESSGQEPILPPLVERTSASLSLARTDTGEHKRIKRPKTCSELFTPKKSINQSFKRKTPLSIAAEMGRVETVVAILKLYLKFTKDKVTSIPKVCGPLAMATKAMSSEALLTLLESSSYSTDDYQEAVLGAIRNVLPDCLAALLYYPQKKTSDVLGGVNLYHMLYTQIMARDDARYRGITMMTRVLLNAHKNVNDCTVPNTFPLYTLITSTFQTKSAKRMHYILQCINVLLSAGANIFYDEVNGKMNWAKNGNASLDLARQPYSSVFHCLFENARKSTDLFGIHNAHQIMNNLVLFVLSRSKVSSSRSASNGSRLRDNMKNIFFRYMDVGVYLGLDRHVIKALLKHGADPNVTDDKRYAINVYFEKLMPYFSERPVVSIDNEYYKNEMHSLMIICETMDRTRLEEMNKTLLGQYVEKKIPVQAVPIARYLFYLVDNLKKRNGWYLP